MSKKLSETYLGKNILSVKPIGFCVVFDVVKTYGEICKLEEAIYICKNTGRGQGAESLIKELIEIAQREGIADYKI